MARQVLQRGSSANDGTGDSLRTAAGKINDNFKEIYATLGDSTGASLLVSFDSDEIVFTDPGNSNTVRVGADVSSTAVISFPADSGTVTLLNTPQTVTQKTIQNSYLDSVWSSSLRISDGLFDSANNELLVVSEVASAVNELTLSNAATGNAPSLVATGDDTNIDFAVGGKGTGHIVLQSSVEYNFDSVGLNASVPGSNLRFTDPLTIVNRLNTSPGINHSYNLTDGSSPGETFRILNAGDEYVNLSITNYGPKGGASTPILHPLAACEFIWSNSGWFLVGDSSGAVISGF